MLIGSYAGAIWSSVGMSCLVSGVFAGMLQSKGEEILLGYIFLLFILGPAITGLSLAVAAKRPRRSNPAGVWIAIVWNSILVGCFILLTIIGMMS